MAAIAGNNRYTLIAMMAILLFSIFIFSPHTVYITNIEQFTVPLATVLKLCLIPVLAGLLIFYPVAKFIPLTVTGRISVMLATLSIMVWFQGNVLLWKYGILDGSGIVWSDYRWRGWIDSGLWISAIFLAATLNEKTGILITRIAVFIFTLQLITASCTTFQYRESIRKDNTNNSLRELTEIFSFSDDRNILHIVVDGFQSDVFDELVSHETRYRNSFQGFVYYRETLGAFPYTSFALPAFLAGKLYTNQLPKNTYIDSIFRGDTIISVAKKEGYEIDIATGGGYLTNRYSNLPYDHLYNLSNIAGADAYLEESAEAMDLGLFRSTPHLLKKYIYNDQQWRLSRHTLAEDFFQFAYFPHTYFLNKFSLEMQAGRKSPVYKYLHIMNTHNPMVVDRDCKYTGKPERMDRKTLTIQSRCTLDTLARFFDRMKELGIYDNTLIVIHGDHGGWVPNYRQGPPVVLRTGNKAPEALFSLASPLLAIKKPHDKAVFRVSEVYASLLDIPDTITDIMNWDADFNYRSLEMAQPGDKRTRTFRFYFWQSDEWETEYASPIHEFSVVGSHYETTWVPGEIYNPP